MADHRFLARRRKFLIFLFNLMVMTCGTDIAGHGRALAAETPAADPAKNSGAAPSEYHTPLAGERRQVNFLGQTVFIPGIDRGKLYSVTLGATVLDPRQDTLGVVPIGALYIRRVWDDSRTRDVISVVENELEYDKRFGPLELVTNFTNRTIPFNQKELVDNREIDATAMAYGDFLASIGPGIRIPVFPYQVDNDAKLQLLGRVGYFYNKKSDDAGADVVAPPDTPLYGVKLRGRYDGMRRNVLELPHSGCAAGWDLDYTHRENWRDLTPGASGSGHRDYLQASGYLVGAVGIPGLSERNKLLMYANAGTTGDNSGDRFNAFLINGGPVGESDDFARPHYTGIIYDEVRATSYATASLGYRRELAFFLYLNLTGSYIWGNRATVSGADQVVFREKTAAAGTASLDMAFLWDSELNLNYTWESGFIREGKVGSGVTLLWNKMF